MGYLLRVLSKIHWPYIEKKIKEEDFNKIKDSLRDGDVLLTTRYGYLTNLQPSKYKHAAIYYKGRVIEATLDGVKTTSLPYFLYSKDVVKHVRFREDIKPDLLYWIESKIGHPYDSEFEGGDEEYYCFELILLAFKKYYSNFTPKSFKILGKERFLSQSFDREFEEVL